LPTTVTARAEKDRLVRPIVAELDLPDGAEVVGGPNRRQLGQLEGRRAFRLDGGARSDGTPDRALATWVVRLPDGVTELGATAWHERAGRAGATVTLG
jgi:hypothetical protein